MTQYKNGGGDLRVACRATEGFPLQLELAVCSNIKTKFLHMHPTLLCLQAQKFHVSGFTGYPVSEFSYPTYLTYLS